MSVHDSLPAGCEPSCHGCRHRSLQPAASLAQKTAYLRRVLAPWSDRLEVVRTIDATQRLGYRDRVTLTAAFDAGDWRFGLMRRDELIPIHECPVHSVRVNRLVAALRATLPTFDRLPLAYLHVAGAQATLIVKAREFAPADLATVCARLESTGIEGLWIHCHPSAGRKLFARSGWHLAWGRAESIGPGGLVHGPTAFQQLLPALHDGSLDVAVRHLRPSADVAVLDLYCGIGASVRRWREAGAPVLGIELAGGAVECAIRNAPGAMLLRGTCVQRLPQIRQWWSIQPGQRVIYVNPPRSGLEPDLCEAMTRELRPDRVAYLSCSAGTLARDLAEFVASGYAVDTLAPFDFFPGTHHVECLALLTRRS